MVCKGGEDMTNEKIGVSDQVTIKLISKKEVDSNGATGK